MATPVILPKQGNSVESCIIQRWLKEPGEQVASGEALCEVETDKAVVEVEAPADGTLLERFAEVDDDVPVLTNIAAIGEAGEDVSDLRPAGEAAAPAPSAATASAPTSEPQPAAAAAPAPASTGAAAGTAGSSPRARALAAAKGIELAAIAGTGPDGMVIERDVTAAVAAGPRLSPTARAAAAAGGLVAPARGSGPAGLVTSADLQPAAAANAPATGEDAISVEPIKGIRKVIAERMHQSLATTAQLTLNARAKATALLAYRQRLKEHGEALGLPKITINDLVCYVVARCLRRFPEVNACFLGDRIERHSAVHLGLAVDTPRGLLVPVLPFADRLSLAELSAAIKPLAADCLDGKVDPARLEGGTFTVTNLGAAGIDFFTPVLNTPQVAILGVGGLSLQPFREDGAIVHHDTLALSLTIDHQALDGAPAARFLQAVVQGLEQVDLLLAQ